jgi:hypothetical protein
VRKTRTIALATAVMLATTGLGCYGQFALTRKIYDWNGHATNNKFANSVITWVLVVIPVYGVCALADFLVFNTIEVFSGRNPIAQESDGSVRVRYAGRDYHISSGADGAFEVRSDGAATIRYRVDGDSVVITDNAGHHLRTLPVAQARAQGPQPAAY